MSQDSPRIIKGFRAHVSLNVIGIFCIPAGAMIIGACRHQVGPREDMIHELLSGVVLIGALVWMLALPYFFVIATPKCNSCRVKTKRYRQLRHEGCDWKITICPLCRERFMYKSFGGD